MSNIEKQLRASVAFDAINGDTFERSVCGKQMLEAATEIQRFEARVKELEFDITEIINRIENAFESGRKTAFTQAAERFDGTLPFNWVAADGYANALDIAGELRYMAYEVDYLPPVPQERTA